MISNQFNFNRFLGENTQTQNTQNSITDDIYNFINQNKDLFDNLSSFMSNLERASIFQIQNTPQNLVEGDTYSFTSNPILQTNSGDLNDITKENVSNSLVEKDGKIGIVNQGADKGDCWLISTINALNETEKGREYLSNLLEFHNEDSANDGYTVVHLALGDVKITDKEVAQARENNEGKYAKGDDDVIIIELAVEKALKNEGGEFAYDAYTPYYVSDLDEKTGEASIEKGNLEKAMYMLTGKAATVYKPGGIIKDGNVISEENGIEKAIALYTQNTSDEKIMNASINNKDSKKDIVLNDLNTGKSINLKTFHQYSVKDISNNEVTLVNPWDSGTDIKISLDDFKNNFNQLEYINLSEKSNDRNYIQKEYTTDGVNKNFKFKYNDGTSSKKTYTNGQLTSVTNFDKNNKAVSKTVYENGKAKETIKCNGESDNEHDTYSIKNEGVDNHKLAKLDANGNIDESSSVTLTDEEYAKLNSLGLLKDEKLSPADIKTLLK